MRKFAAGLACLVFGASAQVPAPEPMQPASAPSGASAQAGALTSGSGSPAGNGITHANRTHAPELGYPPQASVLGAEGRVVGWVYLDANGKPVKTYIGKREPAHMDLFDEAVRAHLMQSRYTPRMREGKPEAGWIESPYNFQLHEESRRPARRVLALDRPDYPAEALVLGVEGWVSLLVLLDPDGKPRERDIRVRNRWPAEFTGFEAPARAAVMRSQFSALPSGGISPQWVFVRIDFSLPQSPATAGAQAPATSP